MMPIDAWLPLGFKLPDGLVVRRPVSEGEDWQIWEAQDEMRVLIASEALAERWREDKLVEQNLLKEFSFGSTGYQTLASGPAHMLVPVAQSRSPNNKAEALSFAAALKASRASGTRVSLHDAIYVERLSRLLPTYTLSPAIADDLVLGLWLTGGVLVSVHATRRIRSLTSWLGAKHLEDVIGVAGLGAGDSETASVEALAVGETGPAVTALKKQFELAGRPALENFFREHVVDIIENAERYQALGIDFPSATVLHGPPGCGKTFAVERLVEYLGWPSFSIDASSVASPYIHETSRKVAGVFDEAMKNSPAVLVIDEMEAFLADREMGAGSSHHRVEEVAEFLRRIPEATKNHVLIIAMTNRVEMIDSAILRRGRFDHVIEVGPASRVEVAALLGKLLGELPAAADVDIEGLAGRLEGRPLSDVAFVVREAARLAARAGKTELDAASLVGALEGAPPRGAERESRGVGFMASWKAKSDAP